jgi:signal transduction histidine kinase
LTAGVGHEVKNPINAMVVHLELLRGKLTIGGAEAFPGAHRHVDILAGEMQRLDRVVQTLADFSRPMELHLREHDLRQVVGAVLELMAAEMEENGVHVTVDAPHEMVMVRADAELMQQAVLNLLLNGMQAMPGGGELRVTMRRDHQFAVVEVIDEGEGILPELLPRIFELYFTTKPKGSGIGLAMTYRILQLHGGAMDVRSNADPNSPERGTVFTFRLPIAAGVEGRKIAAGASHKGIEERV